MPRVIREVYSSAGAGGARPRTRIPPHVVPAKAGTHNHRRASLRRGGSPSVSKQSTAVVMGPGVRRNDKKSTLGECLLDHEMAGLAVAALEEAARLEQLAQLFQHRRAAA